MCADFTERTRRHAVLGARSRRYGSAVSARQSEGLERSSPALPVKTPHGTARVHLHRVPEPRAALVLGHGAGGGVAAPDLVAVTKAAGSAGVAVALVEQPYRVAGRRSTPRPPQLDEAWTAVVTSLLAHELRGLPLVAGGRSAGARVACRTAEATGAIGVLCLAFPLQPPRRSGPPAPSRLAELDGVRVPVLVIQGRQDPFGMPPGAKRRKVVVVEGTHALRGSTEAVGKAAQAWLRRLVDGQP
jgi:predicted alpha/beta-hydrolase family hydrolase